MTRFNPKQNLALAMLLVLSARSAPADEPSPDPYPDHSRLLVYVDDAGREQPVRTPTDWARRRADILTGMQRAMGALPDRQGLSPPVVKVLESTAGRSWTRQKVAIELSADEQIPAWLFLPAGEPSQRHPAMLALHQTTGIGKDEPAGLGGLDNLHYGRELAERGYVVLAPDYPSFGDYAYDYSRSGLASGTIKGVFNHMRCVDALVARDDVDPDRVGVIGHSLGGHNAMFLGAFDERVKVIVSSCGWTPFHDYYGGKIAGWTSDRYMPRLRDVYELNPDRVPFDFYEVVASFAPRAFFSNSPLRDSNFDVAGVKKAQAAVQPIFELLGAENQIEIAYPGCEHDFPPDIRQQAYGFIDARLKPARR